MDFEYVMSGTSMARLPQSTEYQLNTDIYNQFFNDLDYNFSLLFNAYTEPKFGAKYQVYKDSLHGLHADSGGLQIITLGLTAKEVKKKQEEIYKTQALYSSVAMCFDEIPLEITGYGGNDSRTNLSNRFFVHENIQKSAYDTAQNVKKQIEIFDKYNSKSKIMIISHGNCNKSYKEYTETLCDNLTPDELKFIHGVAPSSASNGLGGIERFDMLYGIKEYNIPEHIKSNIHLLGVGSVSGLLPLVHSDNYFDFINHCSFDSSSHARKYSIDGEGFNGKIKKEWNSDKYYPEYEKIYKYFEKYFNMVGKDLNWLIDNATYYSKYNKDKIWYFNTKEEEAEIYKTFLSTFVPFYNIDNLMKQLKPDKKDELLSSINTYNDYKHLRKYIIKRFNLKSNNVSSYNSLSEMQNSIKNKDVIQSLF